MNTGLGTAAALASSVTWALGSVAYSRLAQQYNPQAVNISRALVALPLFVLTTVFAMGGLGGAWASYASIEARHLGWLSVSMIASYALGDVLFLAATARLGVPAALAVASIYPVWTALIGWVLRGEALSPRQGLGLGLALGGVVAVLLLGRAQPPHARATSRSYVLGGALALGTSAFWALNSYAVAHVGSDLNPLLANTVRMLLALVLVPAVGWALGTRGPWILPKRDLLRSYWVIALESFGGSLTFVYGLAHTTLAIGATLSSLAPVLAVPMAWAMRTEAVSWPRAGAVAGVVLGLALLLV